MVIFGDEKKFNLDGPDSFQYSWQNFPTEQNFFSTRQYGRGEIIICDAFSSSGKTQLAVLNES